MATTNTEIVTLASSATYHLFQDTNHSVHVRCICGHKMNEGRIEDAEHIKSLKCSNDHCENPSSIDTDNAYYYCPSDDNQHPNGFYYCSACATDTKTAQKYTAPYNTTTDVSPLTQIQLVLWKNYKTQIKRRKWTCCCKMCCPCVFSCILIGYFLFLLSAGSIGASFNCDDDDIECVDFEVGSEDHNVINKYTYTADSEERYDFITKLVCGGSWRYDPILGMRDIGAPAYIGVIFDDESESHVESVIDIIATNYGSRETNEYRNETINDEFECAQFVAQHVNWTEGSLLKYFKTNDALDEYVRDDYYNEYGFTFDNDADHALRPIAAAIVFKSVSKDGTVWDYSLRFEPQMGTLYTAYIDEYRVPKTFDNNEDQIVNVEQKSLEFADYTYRPYFSAGFIGLQNIVDTAITEYVALHIDGQSTVDTTYIDFAKGYFEFPAARYEVNVYWEYYFEFVYPFSIFSAVIFVYPFVHMIYILVSERASKLREGMKMMGLNSTIYWISTYIWYCIEFTLISLFIVIVGIKTGTFQYSNGFIAFIWFWLFAMSQVAFGTLISVFFDNTKTATIVGFVLYFVLFALSFAMTSLNEAGKTMFCLLAMPCYMDSINVLRRQETAIIGVHWNNLGDHSGQMSMRIALNMLFIDTILYILLTLYFDSVWPTRFGQKRSPIFCLKKTFWNSFRKRNQKDIESYHFVPDDVHKLNIDDMHHYEEMNQQLQNTEPAIMVRDLSKTFPSGFKSREIKAVRGISLDIYNGEVFCLLGHNGAGKTTTISMLSGLLASSGGGAYINGYNVNLNMNDIRKFLGVCPQHDVLWDNLTVTEHLKFFARLKGVPPKQIQTEIDRILNVFDMMDSNLWGQYPAYLSGGERRRLSLAIALIGGSQIVFLDEPTSGMDPENRRKIWDIIEKEKENRCIILTTHYMDEADTLGDRIAIMSYGRIKCCGSPLYLKRLYGVGYTFTVSLKTEVNLEEEKESVIKDSIDDILAEIHGAETISVAASEILYKLPFDSCSSFGNVFAKLDENRNNLSIDTVGVSVTTLEEVFLKIGTKDVEENDEENEEEEIKYQRQRTKDVFQQPEFHLESRNCVWIFFVHVYAMLYKRFWWSTRDVTGVCCQIVLPVLVTAIVFSVSTTPLLIKQKELQLSPDQYVDEFTESVVIPISKSDDTDAEYQHMMTIYDERMRSVFGNQQLYSIPNASPNCLNRMYDAVFDANCSDIYPQLRYISYNRYDIFTGDKYSLDANCTTDFSEEIFYSNRKDNIPYFAFYFSPFSVINCYDDEAEFEPEILFGVNVSAYHSFPIAFNVWNNWVLKEMMQHDDTQAAQINVYSHPLPVTKALEEQMAQGKNFAYVVMLIIAFTLIPASSTYFIVNEKMMNTKHQQYVSGISIPSYWTATWISDILLGIPASSLVVVLVYIFNVEELKGAALMPFYLTLICFVSSAISFSYVLYPLFKSPGKAQLVIILLNVLFGTTLYLIVDTLSQIGVSTVKLSKWCRILPVFMMAENISEIINNSGKSRSYWNEDISTRNIQLMIVESIGYFAFIIILEYAKSFGGLLVKLGFVVDQPRKLMRLDEDVIAEQERIKQAIDPETGFFDNEALEDTVVLSGLRKVYKAETKFVAPKPAVRDMYFGVKQGQIFGFLGVNGAGKTSTLQLLIGENYPSAGIAYINGKSIVSEQLAIRRNIGFCPQKDALFDLLTAYEHLKFYAMIKGLRGNELERQIQVLLNSLSLNKYSKRTAGTYSGGNKRKLCVAQAMIGNPPVIFLDEPSTGMDPESRRFMWKFISYTMAGRAVILTTHSMEECDALCDRVGIMVAGQLSCIGSPQYLKSKFGRGYQLDITLRDNEMNDKRIYELLEEFNETFPTTILQRNANKLLMQIRDYDENITKLAALSQMFAFVESLKDKYNFASYAMSQTSMEQIFLKMAEAKGKTKEMDDYADNQKQLLNLIKTENKQRLVKRIRALNRDHLEQIIENEIRNSSQYVIRALTEISESEDNKDD